MCLILFWSYAEVHDSALGFCCVDIKNLEHFHIKIKMFKMFHTFTHLAVHFSEMLLWILMFWRLKIIIWQLTNKCCGEDNKMKSFTLSYIAGKNHTCHWFPTKWLQSWSRDVLCLYQKGDICFGEEGEKSSSTRVGSSKVALHNWKWLALFFFHTTSYNNKACYHKACFSSMLCYRSMWSWHSKCLVEVASFKYRLKKVNHYCTSAVLLN